MVSGRVEVGVEGRVLDTYIQPSNFNLHHVAASGRVWRQRLFLQLLFLA